MDAWLSNKETIRKSKRYYAHFDVKTDIGHVIMFRIRNLLQCMLLPLYPLRNGYEQI